MHEDVYDEVVDRVVATLGRLPVGDPLDPATVVGPVVTEAAMERILGVIDRAAADGATLLAGGGRLGGELADGWFVAPTVFGDVDHDSDLARNEVFGPVQAILRFSSEDEVLARANDSPYGLAAYVHTADPTAGTGASTGWRPGWSWSTVWGDCRRPRRSADSARAGSGARAAGRLRGDGAAHHRAGRGGTHGGRRRHD